MDAIKNNQSHYCPSPGIPEFRQAAAEFVRTEFDIPAEAANIVAGPGAKVFQQFFCEAFLNPGDGVLVFSPYFPTLCQTSNGAALVPCWRRCVKRTSFGPTSPTSSAFSPRTLAARDFLNSPHNPTGASRRSRSARHRRSRARPRRRDLQRRALLPHGLEGQAPLVAEQPGMLAQSVARVHVQQVLQHDGWRLGFAVASAEIADVIAKMINTTLSCTPPIVQLAGTAALKRDRKERDDSMLKFREKVVLLTEGLNRIEGFRALDPTATFYVFPNVARVCNELGVTSHGLALYMLQGADDHFGIACLGGECFGQAGGGFLRFSCADR
jgi:aspartate aminotransferase